MRITGFNGIVLTFLIFQTCSILALWYRIEGRSSIPVNNTDAQEQICIGALSEELVAIRNGIRDVGNYFHAKPQTAIDFEELKDVMTETLEREARKSIIQECGSVQEQIAKNEDLESKQVDTHIMAAANSILDDAMNAGVWTQDDSQAIRDAGISQLAPSERQKLLQQFAQAINSQRLHIKDPSSFFDAN